MSTVWFDTPHPPIPSDDPCRRVRSLHGKFGGFLYQNTDPRFANCASLYNHRQQRRRLWPIVKETQNAKVRGARGAFKWCAFLWKNLTPENQAYWKELAADVDMNTYAFFTQWYFSAIFLPDFLNDLIEQSTPPSIADIDPGIVVPFLRPRKPEKFEI